MASLFSCWPSFSDASLLNGVNTMSERASLRVRCWRLVPIRYCFDRLRTLIAGAPIAAEPGSDYVCQFRFNTFEVEGTDDEHEEYRDGCSREGWQIEWLIQNGRTKLS